MSAMEIGIQFRLGGEEADKRFEAAQQLATQLSAVECPLHKKCAKVQVALDDKQELAWAINESCCEELKVELTKVIQKASKRHQRFNLRKRLGRNCAQAQPKPERCINSKTIPHLASIPLYGRKVIVPRLARMHIQTIGHVLLSISSHAHINAP